MHVRSVGRYDTRVRPVHDHKSPIDVSIEISLYQIIEVVSLLRRFSVVPMLRKLCGNRKVLGQGTLNKKEDLIRSGRALAEHQAERQIAMKMSDWIQKLDAFLQFNEYDILQNAGSVSHKVAEATAIGEYEKFRVIQDKNFESDFDKAVKKISRQPKK